VSNSLGSLIPLVLIILAFWFLVLRPARKRQKDFVNTQQALEPGTRVMLASGIFGELVTIGEDEVQIRVAPEVVITAARQAVARVVHPDAPDRDVADEPEADSGTTD
jgi:preprotein translocase subunit YajC